MALKLKHVIDVPEDVIGPVRSYYTQGDDGKYHLSLDGDPPKLAEFRAKNIELLKERDALKARYEGIDPEAVKADKAKLAELEARPDAVKLLTDLENEKAAHASTMLKHLVTSEFLKLGGRASAIEYTAAEAAKVFAMDADGVVTSKEFSATDPASPLSIAEWMQKQMSIADFTFQPSRGGGALSRSGNTRTFGAPAGQTVLKNPTAQELGQHAADIASGKVKVEHSS